MRPTDPPDNVRLSVGVDPLSSGTYARGRLGQAVAAHIALESHCVFCGSLGHLGADHIRLMSTDRSVIIDG